MVLVPLLVRQIFHWLFEPVLSEILKPKNIEPLKVPLITKQTEAQVRAQIHKEPHKLPKKTAYEGSVAIIPLQKASELNTPSQNFYK